MRAERISDERKGMWGFQDFLARKKGKEGKMVADGGRFVKVDLEKRLAVSGRGCT